MARKPSIVVIMDDKLKNALDAEVRKRKKVGTPSDRSALVCDLCRGGLKRLAEWRRAEFKRETS